MNPEPAPIAPLTILVGENSAGKTSFLALARIAWELSAGNLNPDFNLEPFMLGSFAEIAHYRGGKAGRAKEFEIAATYNVGTKTTIAGKPVRDLTIGAIFVRVGSQPAISKYFVKMGDFEVSINYGDSSKSAKFELKVGANSEEIKLDTSFIGKQVALRSHFGWDVLEYLLRGWSMNKEAAKKIRNLVSMPDARKFANVLYQQRRLRGSPPFAGAPVRSRPKRTYDPTKDTPEPEGGHVPMVLAKTYFGNKTEWERLKNSFDAFGEASGLFDEIKIRPLGKSETDPFQIRIRLNAPAFNLIDVGYGVSQVLPILNETIRGESGRTFLLQQPEVHLHPRAQAELGSFLGRLVKERRHRFIIETHSDYLIDRVRMEIRDGASIRSDQVALLFLERDGPSSQIHHLKIDRDGNIINAPRGYRSFFLDEQKRLFEQ